MGRISSWQFFMLIMGFLVGTSTLIMPVGPAKQDSWISHLLAGALGVAAAYFYASLGRRFPNETPMQYAPRILGKWLGSVFNFMFLWYAFHLAALLLLNFSELYVVAIMVTTPLIVFIGVMAALAGWAVRSGLEIIARLAELLTPLILISIIVLNILTLATPGLARWENLLPVMAEGLLPIVRGIWPAFAFPFAEAVFLLVIIPFLISPRQNHRPFIWAVVVVGLILASVMARNIVVLGAKEAARVNFPSLTTIQLINIGDFLQRLDPLIIFIWTFAVFIKLSVVLYVLTLGTAQVLGLADYRPLVLPFALLLTFFAPSVYEHFQQMLRFASRTWPFYFFPGYFLYPVVLWLVAKIRGIQG